MKNYNSYHTSIKQLAKRGKLPHKYTSSIDRSTIWRWKKEADEKCLSSPFQLCRRIYATQLTRNEVNRMKEMLSDQRFRYWPVNSIAYFALRNNIVSVSLATWYNYINKLGWVRPQMPKKPKYETGIRAEWPHQIWHADITVVKCLNGMKYYVYLLMDNFSRFILNYQVSERVSADIRMQSVRQVKYHYLFKQQFHDIHELRKLLDWIIPDYQYRRPHHSLGGLTPYEALNGTSLPKNQWRKQILDARKTRLQQNAKEQCELC